MKILWITPSKSLKNSGLDKFSNKVILNLRSNGYDIETIDAWPIDANSKLLFNLLIAPIHLFLISFKYDRIVVGAESFANSIILVRKKSIITLHHYPTQAELGEKNIKFLDKLKVYYLKLMYLISKKCSFIITASHYTQQQCKLKLKFSNSKMLTIYNPFSIDEFTKIKKPKKDLFKEYNIEFNKDMIYLINVGTELNRKNFITLLESIKLLSEKKFYLIKIGKPASNFNRNIHLNFVEKHNLQVKFIDFIEDQDLIDFYHACDIYVNPSLLEGFGRTPIEAQACGLPVISTHCGALGEVLGDSAYLIKEPMNPKDYKKAILEVSANNELHEKLVMRGYENIQRFTLEKQVEKWKTVLGSLN